MNKCEGVYCLTLHIIVKYDLFCDNDNVQEVIWVGQRSPKVYHCALHTRLNSLDAIIIGSCPTKSRLGILNAVGPNPIHP